MSLRAFHIVFVIASVILSLWVAAWGFMTYSRNGSSSALTLGVVFILSAVALLVYGVKVFRKLRDLP